MWVGGMVFIHKDCMQYTKKKNLYCFTMHVLVHCICTAVHEAS